jgi:hypothetical protein
MADTWTEMVVFMHGITPEEVPGSHHNDYLQLFEALKHSLSGYPDKPKLFDTPIEVEWGYQGSHSQGEDEFLAQAELNVLKSAVAEEQNVHDFTIDPRSVLRLLRPVVRQLLILAFADMFYYVSKDGEIAIRRHVFTDLAEQIQKAQQQAAGPVSLTFIGHSGGGIILHDLLYHLFRDPAVLAQKEEAGEAEYAGIKTLRGLIAAGKLRLRRFYTMGSPITPLMFRSDTLVEKLRTGAQLDPEDIGLRAADQLSNPRWVNLIDKDDMAAYPLEFFYLNPAAPAAMVVQDQYLDVSDNPMVVHGKYWGAPAVAAAMAATF